MQQKLGCKKGLESQEMEVQKTLVIAGNCGAKNYHNFRNFGANTA